MKQIFYLVNPWNQAIQWFCYLSTLVWPRCVQ
jgi:hypothetical protein